MDSSYHSYLYKNLFTCPDYWFGLINALFFSGTIIAGLWINHKDRFFTQINYPIIIYVPLLLAFINLSFILHHSIMIALLFSIIYGHFRRHALYFTKFNDSAQHTKRNSNFYIHIKQFI